MDNLSNLKAASVAQLADPANFSRIQLMLTYPNHNQRFHLANLKRLRL